jgi:hypothetical protein
MQNAVNKLRVKEIDGGQVYSVGKKKFEVCGEYEFGEAWILGEHYYYTRDDGFIVLADCDVYGIECYRFEDTEDGWEAFAKQVLA